MLHDEDVTICSRSLDPVPFDLRPVIGSESLPLLQVGAPIARVDKTVNLR